MSPDFIETLSSSQIEELTALYQSEWWTKGRSRQHVEAMLGGCVVLGVTDPETGRLVAFARALTDGVFKALIFDVIVAEPYRRLGLGHTVMERLLGHPRVRPARHKELYCLPQMFPFYKQFGFSEDVGEIRLMRLDSASARTGASPSRIAP